MKIDTDDENRERSNWNHEIWLDYQSRDTEKKF